jgi:hypothetical protein
MLKNLYFVGHWTQPGGGITPVIVSAMQVAKKVINNDSTAFGRSFMGLESTLCQRENEQSFTRRQ